MIYYLFIYLIKAVCHIGDLKSKNLKKKRLQKSITKVYIKKKKKLK